MTSGLSLPVIDMAPLLRGRGRGHDGRGRAEVARQIDVACRDTGFFYVVGHGVDESLQARLEAAARQFFALPEADKAAIAMARAGRAWRGWFPLDGELTSGVPDHKEGVYFSAELTPDHPRVAAGVPLHGANLFPEHPAALRPTVLAYMDALTTLGHHLAEGIALALGLDASWFATHLTADPTVLFRIFHYPPMPDADGWGVAEHTDYGLLTMLRQDTTGGLEVCTDRGWQAAPPIPGSFVCNLGDMLERMTGGRYRSTPHRVRNPGIGDRVSFAFFFDPSWDAEVAPLPLAGPPSARSRGRGVGHAADRWDGASVLDLRGTYGDYLLAKVARVFPELGGQVLGDDVA